MEKALETGVRWPSNPSVAGSADQWSIARATLAYGHRYYGCRPCRTSATGVCSFPGTARGNPDDRSCRGGCRASALRYPGPCRARVPGVDGSGQPGTTPFRPHRVEGGGPQAGTRLDRKAARATGRGTCRLGGARTPAHPGRIFRNMARHGLRSQARRVAECARTPRRADRPFELGGRRLCGS